jgi:hypothetical protein
MAAQLASCGEERQGVMHLVRSGENLVRNSAKVSKYGPADNSPASRYAKADRVVVAAM